MRVKLAARGGGRWQSSGGYRSKFGLTVAEILRGLEELKARGMEDCFQLLHFHLGSQIPNIRIVKGALNEAARVYVELVQGRRRAASTWTSAAASASTTTARRPTSSRAPTTRSRNTPTTSSITSRACATRRAWRTRRSCPRAAARWSRITACSCSTSWACRASATSRCRRSRPTTWSSRSST